MRTETKYALGFEFDKESPVRLVKLCKVMADAYMRLPAFRHCSSEQILNCLASEVLPLLDDHLMVSSSIDTDPTYGTMYLEHIEIDVDNLCCNLAAATFEHFAFGGHVQLPYGGTIAQCLGDVL